MLINSISKEVICFSRIRFILYTKKANDAISLFIVGVTHNFSVHSEVKGHNSVSIIVFINIAYFCFLRNEVA